MNKAVSTSHQPQAQKSPSGSLRGVSGWMAMLVLAAFLAPQSFAKVGFKTLPDGRTLMFNETETQKARRTSSRLLRVPKPEIDRLISYHAARVGLNPRLVQAVVQVESGYNVKAVSSKGAQGLMQLMPGTARDLGVRNAYDADQNIRGGTDYLRQMLDRFSGDISLALAGYNAGPNAVIRHKGVPPYRETKNYIKKILGLYRGVPSSEIRTDNRLVASRQPSRVRRAPSAKSGSKIYMSRDKNNRVHFSNVPPSGQKP